jgi:hypothetical protein
MMKKYLLLLILAFLCMPATADYSPDGFLLRTVEKGEVNGGIYVGGGHGRVYTTSYTQSFIVPNGTVKWARLYVSAKDTPWINVSFNGHLLGNYTDFTSNPKVYANYKEDGSMYWAYYDSVADYIVKGSNTATANLGSISGKSPKSWGIAIVAVYEGGDAPELIEYRVNEGNPLLHGDQASFIAHCNTTNTSFEPVDTTGITGAALWTGYIWGSEYEEPHDTLFFNSQLIAVNASDGAGIDDLGNVWRTACFDLEEWNVSQSLKENNVVHYDRGGDDLLSPVLAVLVLKHGTNPPANQAVHLGASIRPAIAIEVTPSSMDFGELAPGETSKGRNLTVNNKGSFSINVTAEVSDSAENLFVDGVLLNESSWKLYTAAIPKNSEDKPIAKLHVPEEYAGVGSKEGTLVFWAQKS